jgi:hypothetical protein
MPRTLLIGGSNTSWREWLKTHKQDRDLLCLDPSDAVQGHAGRFSLNRRERPIWERFYGSLDPQKSPHLIIAALVDGLSHAKDESIIQLFPYRPTPVLRQTTQLILDLCQPTEILVDSEFEFRGFRLPIEPQPVDLNKSFPSQVQQAQRKAQWLGLIERCENHTVDLRETIIEGVRLGSGNAVDEHQKSKLKLENAYVEVVGSSLLVVSDSEFDDTTISRAMDYTHCARVNIVSPQLYEGCVCAFSKQTGVDFGFGYVQKIDFVNRRASVRCTAIPPVPVPTLRIGSLRIDDLGTEMGELKPWQI